MYSLTKESVRQSSPDQPLIVQFYAPINRSQYCLQASGDEADVRVQRFQWGKRQGQVFKETESTR